MSRIELASGVGDDLDRILDHLESHDASNIPVRIREIIEAIGVLEHNPLIGRPASEGNRELIIGRRSFGYVALYRYMAEIDTVLVLALRSQREAGYSLE